MSIQRKEYENTDAGFSMWIYENTGDRGTSPLGDDDCTVTTDLAGYSCFAFTFANRADRDAFLALLQHVTALDID